MTAVAVVIGSYECEEVLGECLRSLAEQEQPPAELVVVDGASTDGSVAVARAHGATVIETANLGLGHLYNRGVAAVGAPYVLVSNPDVAFDRACLRLLAEALDARPDAFAADPTQYDWGGERVIHARTTLARGPLLRVPVPGLRVDPLVPADRVVETLHANAGAMLVRRDRFLELGGFDEKFFLDFEDIDLGWRAWLRGWPSLYVPDATVRHKVGVSTRPAMVPVRVRSSHQNAVRFALKCLPAGPAARVVAGQLLRLPRHPETVGPALLRVARDLPAILRERRRLRPSARVFAERLAG